MFELRGVTRSYGQYRAADNLNLRFAVGSVTAVVGSSGSGKSTLLKLLLGLQWPDAGEIRVNGAKLTRENLVAVRRGIGYVIQDGGLFPHLNVLANLALLPRQLAWGMSRIRERGAELAALTQLPGDVLSRFPDDLSGGQRQRVALMRALMTDPPALLLDEPLGALDPIVRHDLQGELKAIFEQLGKTVIVVTHDIGEAAFLAPRIVLMEAGRVLQDGGFADLQQTPKSEFVTRFIGAQRLLPGSASVRA